MNLGVDLARDGNLSAAQGPPRHNHDLGTIGYLPDAGRGVARPEQFRILPIRVDRSRFGLSTTAVIKRLICGALNRVGQSTIAPFPAASRRRRSPTALTYEQPSAVKGEAQCKLTVPPLHAVVAVSALRAQFRA